MNKIELIKQVIEKKQKSLDALKKKERDVEEKKSDAKAHLMMEYFGDSQEEGDTIEISGSYIYFKRPNKDYSYSKEVLTLNIRPKSWRDDEADSIETSFYSTNNNSDFELRRMVLLGKVGQVILDFKDDIIAGYNKIEADFKKQLSDLRTKSYELGKEISAHKSEINAIEDNELLSRLRKDGLEFEVDEDNLYRLPSLDVRFNWEVNGIKKIKVVGETKSGKSVDVEIVKVYKQWCTESQEYTLSETINTYERVRKDKVDRLVKWNKEKVLNHTPAFAGA
jgi:hypothetical protein